MSELKSAASPHVVLLSYWVFFIWWLLILAVHVMAGTYTASYAYSYWILHKTYLNYYLEMYQIGMPSPYHHIIVMVHIILSALHGICIVFMVGGSLKQHAFAFTPWSSCQILHTEIQSSPLPKSTKWQNFIKNVTRYGSCGVGGKYFHTVLLCRELIETALQTVQAYRMSVLLPRKVLNQSYVGMLVTNCWSSVLVYSFFFKGNEARRRFVCIVLDCVLDLMASMGIELIILLSYVGDYDPKLRGFPDALWQNDEWAASVFNEFRMIVVVSWSDLASRVIFALGLIMTTTKMKAFLYQRQYNGNRVGLSTTAPSIDTLHAAKGQIPAEKLDALVPSPPKKVSTAAIATSGMEKYHRWNLRTRGGQYLVKTVHLIFGVWGFVVLGFHIHASLQPELRQCLIQLKPWAVSKPPCFLIGIDCYTLGISGTRNEVEKQWIEFDSFTVFQLLIRHCYNLEIPDSIQQFRNLHVIKVYNSTIVEWTESAALTNTHHPNLYSAFIARGNVTDGLLPAGLQSSDFPHQLRTIEFCVTNLRALPDNLDLKWRRNSRLQFEYSQLTEVPSVLVRLEPSYLVLTGSLMTSIPSEVFEIPGLLSLGLGEINLNELPRNVTNMSKALKIIFLDGTGISFFWKWIDDFITLERGGQIVATGSPYCLELEEISHGTAFSFSAAPSPEYSSVLMNPTSKNLPFIWYAVKCANFQGPFFYCVTCDDAVMAISIPPPLARP